MKTICLTLVLSACVLFVQSQITTPVIIANFGVDADLRSNYFNGGLLPGNDDWFSNNAAGSGGFIIDTTGAAALLQMYATDPSSRLQPVYRGMNMPWFSLMNNKLLIDGGYVRDHHGSDSTAFAANSNKNGMSPANWTSTGTQPVPAKNDILDMFVHVRRDGPSASDSMWFFGGISLDDNVGNRYFDFEMYQTNLAFNKSTNTFTGIGPDAGHTAWLFDSAGNVLRPGDIIFSAEYGSSSLTMIEARIWIDKASLSVTPVNFDWTGTAEGESQNSTFVYAGIGPKNGGNFYTGLQSAANTWAGPFALVLKDNSVVTDYKERQFMEFSVNLTKLGLDSYVLTGDACGSPFRRVLVKTRAATSFSAELKDFVGPVEVFNVPKASAAADFPILCGSENISTLQVANPVSTSIYNWTTPDGNIVGSSSGASVVIDTAGTYIVTQQLQASCPVYAIDTVVITQVDNCASLDDLQIAFTGERNNQVVHLNWTVNQNNQLSYFTTERSPDGINFSTIGKTYINPKNSETASYFRYDNISGIRSPFIYYRLKTTGNNHSIRYSDVIRISNTESPEPGIKIFSNPVKDKIRFSITASAGELMLINLYDFTGKLVYSTQKSVQQGTTVLTVPVQAGWTNGVYIINARTRHTSFTERLVLMK